MGGVRKRVATAATAVTVVTAVTAVFFYTNPSHPVPPYDTYHITLSDFALRPPMSGYNGWESTHKHEHSSLYGVLLSIRAKRTNDPFRMILFKRQVYPSLYTEYLTGRENTGSAVQTSRWRMLRKPYQVCF